MIRLKAFSALFIAIIFCFNGNAQTDSKDPFLPYLTGQPPEIVKELGQETQDGVKISKLIFLSRQYEGSSGKDSALIFAVVVRPEKPGNYPGLLVLHGGGGNAEIEKAKKWAALGYVVVAPDEPGVASPQKIPLSQGPWDGLAYGANRFVVCPDMTCSTLFDAVLASVQALYLLRSQPDVIKDKVGIVGISWGGYLTSIVSGLAHSFIAASFSVYGCGYYDSGTTFEKELDKMTVEDRDVWLTCLDAGRRINQVKTPFFIAAATNDNWFYPPAVTQTLQAASGYTNHLFAANANHAAPLPGGTADHLPETPGWLKMEQDYFAWYLKGTGLPLPEITHVKQQVIDKNVRVRFKVKGPAPVAEAHVAYSMTDTEWPKRQWTEQPAVRKSGGWYETALPAGQEIDWFITISDTRPVTVSSYITKHKPS